MVSDFEASKRISEQADWEALARLAPKLNDVMTEESLNKATAAMLVSSLVGWFWTTLDPQWRHAFEQLIETQFHIGAEHVPEARKEQEYE